MILWNNMSNIDAKYTLTMNILSIQIAMAKRSRTKMRHNLPLILQKQEEKRGWGAAQRVCRRGSTAVAFFGVRRTTRWTGWTGEARRRNSLHVLTPEESVITWVRCLISWRRDKEVYIIGEIVKSDKVGQTTRQTVANLVHTHLEGSEGVILSKSWVVICDKGYCAQHKVLIEIRIKSTGIVWDMWGK